MAPQERRRRALDRGLFLADRVARVASATWLVPSQTDPGGVHAVALIDGHLRCGAPSVTIIPAGVEHTSQDTGDGESWLVDVFAPPRADFLARGIVRNAAEYDVSG